MVTVNYDVLPDEMFINYLDFLVGRIFKILPMREQEDDGLYKYMCSLQRELIGNKDLIIELKNDGNFITVLGKLQYLISNKDIDISIFKKDVFDCISLINKLKTEYERRR